MSTLARRRDARCGRTRSPTPPHPWGSGSNRSALSRSGARGPEGLDGAELGQDAEVVADGPVLVDLAVGHSQHVDLAHGEAAAGRGDPEERVLVRAAHAGLDPHVIAL